MQSANVEWLWPNAYVTQHHYIQLRSYVAQRIFSLMRWEPGVRSQACCVEGMVLRLAGIVREQQNAQRRVIISWFNGRPGDYIIEVTRALAAEHFERVASVWRAFDRT